jgi:mRNA interferase MazF
VADPRRGDIWLGNLDPILGREQAGKRPLLVISDDRFNSGRSGLVIVVLLTTHLKNIPFHVTVEPPEGGLKSRSYVKCEDIRSVALERLETLWGSVSSATLREIENRVRLLLSLD